MAQVDVGTAVTQFVGTLPTFTAVLLAWTQNNKRIDDVGAEVKSVREELKDAIRSESVLICAEMRRVEEVMDARLKHLEERESH